MGEKMQYFCSAVTVFSFSFFFFTCLLCQLTDMMNGKDQDVYRLPPPTSSPVGESGEPVNLRIPQIERPTVTKVLCELFLLTVKIVNDNLVAN